MTKIKHPRTLIIFTIISIIILCITLTAKTFQNDTFYIIKLGEHLVNHGCDFLDHWSWVQQFPYNYPHFLYDIFIYLIYTGTGFFGIYVSNIILFIILGLSFYYVSSKLIPRRSIASITSIIFILLISSFITARGQIVSYSLFIWEFYLLLQLAKTGRKILLLPLALISWLIAMVHATIWPFTFILYIPLVLEVIIAKIIHNPKLPKPNLKLTRFIPRSQLTYPVHLKPLIISLIIGILVGLLTPTRICFSYLFLTMAGNSQNYILEHLPLVLLNTLPFAFILCIFILTMTFTKVKIRFSYFLIIIGLTVMAFFSNRHVALFYVLAFPLIGIVVNDALTTLNPRFIHNIQSCLSHRKIYIITTLLILICATGGAIKHWGEDYISPDVNCDGAITYIKKNLDKNNLRLFNDYNFGSYLMFHDIPVFIDSRADPYQPKFNGTDLDVFSDSFTIINGHYEELFQKYNINYILTYKNKPLGLILQKDQNYHTLYQDDTFVLLEKSKN